MIVYPALDLLDGRCVRLRRGNFEDVTVYRSDPVATARQLAQAGARALHVVDLDGARAGRPLQAATIGAIARAVQVPVQAGGGLRTSSDIQSLLEAGVHRVLLGTAALRDLDLAASAVQSFGGDRVGVAVDVRAGSVMVAGWTQAVDRSLSDVLVGLAAADVEVLLVTDIARDGTLEGPNVDLYRGLAHQPFRVIAAGGIASVESLHALADLGLDGAVVGRGLYEGRLVAGDLGAFECS